MEERLRDIRDRCQGRRPEGMVSLYSGLESIGGSGIALAISTGGKEWTIAVNSGASHHRAKRPGAMPDGLDDPRKPKITMTEKRQ